MVSTVNYLAGRIGQRIVGFGARRRITTTRRTARRTGRGPSKTALVKRIASAILAGTGRRRVYKKRTVSGSSYKLSGQGKRRKPRATLTHPRTRVAY